MAEVAKLLPNNAHPKQIEDYVLLILSTDHPKQVEEDGRGCTSSTFN